MKVLTIILSAIMMANALQQDAHSFWDSVLDKYEALCDACLSHKSSREVTTLTKEFKELMSSPIGKMDRDQTRRFVNIQNRYKGIISVADIPSDVSKGSLIKVDTVRRVEHIQIVDTTFIKAILGQVEIIQTSVNKDTIFHIIQYKENPVEQTATTIESPTLVKPKVSCFVLASIGVAPDISYGALIGTLVDRWGGYAKFRSNYRFITKDYDCTSDGRTSGGIIWTDGESTVSRLTGTIGVTFGATYWLTAYAGAGYGFTDLFWKDYSGRYARVTDTSVSGISIDLGAVAHFSNLAISIGLNCSGFRYCDLEFGVGVCF